MRLILSVLVVLAALEAQAGTTLGDRRQIGAALALLPPCCVVDARSALPRALRPLKDAIAWSKDIRIVPTGTVVVVADSDKEALAVARRIAARFQARHVLAVKGGFDTWRDVLAAAAEPGMPATFVIPKNTCEQGTPIQILRSDRH